MTSTIGYLRGHPVYSSEPAWLIESLSHDPDFVPNGKEPEESWIKKLLRALFPQ